jgi:hypothetical protein
MSLSFMHNRAAIALDFCEVAAHLFNGLLTTSLTLRRWKVCLDYPVHPVTLCEIQISSPKTNVCYKD